MSHQKTIYSFIGLPASGKGTQASILAKKIKAKVIGIGDLIRETIKDTGDDPFLIDIKKRYDDGTPQPDAVAIDLVTAYLGNIDSDVIFDNFPFSNGQAEFLSNYLSKHSEWEIIIIYIELAPETAIRRATSRKICSGCGAIYEATDEMICKKCGGSLAVRSDDNEETVRARISQYLPKINEVIKYFENSNSKIIKVDGEKSIEEVSGEIASKI
ncbi:hypothetical protein COT78_02520 [Candidatus Berkelbacteria bacterium CG10_big_fil_rev_8_21_14_0_10_43_13]|uniref:Adenylate kinase n=1 Tax=Candidatus Berkelbacteria bacterium CG10_big_fil_rev_8_21_14_0_10_43_13 TaxID=1974514 RepID=A0A2H0W640_9BACT|nr:MAG: hypothetical protein COT78_02520 [Candidatus Berkelbacteria bacterium CG10_big_fil_rev_8_21_14_0_10_43_13]